MKKGCVCLCLVCMLAMSVPGHPVIAQSQQTQEQAEVENLLREYYKACSDGDLEKAGSLIAMKDSCEGKVLGKWAKECGVKEYDKLMRCAKGRADGRIVPIWNPRL